MRWALAARHCFMRRGGTGLGPEEKWGAASLARCTQVSGNLPNPMGKRGLMACLETAPYTLKAAGIPGGSANVRM